MYSRKKYSNLEEIVKFLESELNKSGQLHGYRWMHLRCLQNNLVVTQDIVRELLWYLDPTGVESRKRKRLRRRQYFNKGPNYLWHMDSYDKLKPYGICINGCVDGFSRYIIWLHAGSTASDPKVFYPLIHFQPAKIDFNRSKEMQNEIVKHKYTKLLIKH